MKRKIVILMMCAMVSASMLTACGAKKETVADAQMGVEESEEEAGEEDAAQEQEPEEETGEEDAAQEQQPEEETDTQEPVDEEVDVKQDDSLGATDGTGDAYPDTASCMEEIYHVQAGTAGSSSRLEPAAEHLVMYVNSYGSKLTENDVADLANRWFDVMVVDDEYVRDNYSECLEAVVSEAVLNNESLENDPAFTMIVEGMRAAIRK